MQIHVLDLIVTTQASNTGNKKTLSTILLPVPFYSSVATNEHRSSSSNLDARVTRYHRDAHFQVP